MIINFLSWSKGDPNKLVGSIKLENGKIAFSGSAKNVSRRMFENIDLKDISQIESALKRAPEIYTSTYLRAEIVSEKHYTGTVHDQNQQVHAGGTSDKSLAVYNIQDKEIESISKQVENREVGLRLEHVGDIIRELLLQDVPDKRYIGEKLRRIRNNLQAIKTHVSDSDKMLLQKAYELYGQLPMLTRHGYDAKVLARAIAMRDLDMTESVLDDLESWYKSL